MKFFSSTIFGVFGFSVTLFLLTSIVSNQKIYSIKFDRYEELKKIDSLSFEHQKVDIETETRNEVVYTNRDMYFNKNPKFLVWIGIISMGVGISVAFLPWLLSVLFQDLNDEKIKVNQFLFIFIAILSMFVVFIFAHFQVGELILLPPEIMAKGKVLFPESAQLILLSLVLLQFFGPLFVLACNFIINYKMGMYLEKPELAYTTKDIIRFKKISAQMLLASSIILVFGIIESSLLRESILGAIGLSFSDIFPKEFVIAYGLVFTAFLMFFYLPGYFLINRVIDMRLTEAQEQNQKPEIEYLSTYSNKETIEIFISILAPVVSSILLEVII